MSSPYAREIDLRDINNAHSLGVLSVRPGSRVLDIGAASGTVAAALADRGCHVWAVEIDKSAACEAEQFCERVAVGDVEAMDLESEFRGLAFDTILFLDVLEHLRDPGETLRRALPLLAANGRVVASIPNVAHAAVRLQLMHGNFAYTETGLLDHTHLHLFDRAAVEKLFRDADLVVLEDLRVTRSLLETEIDIDPGSFPPDVLAAATSDLHAETYQFFIVASPREEGMAASPPPSLNELLQDRVHELEKMASTGADHVASLEKQIADRDAHVAQLEDDYRDVIAKHSQLENVLRDRMKELQAIHDERKHLQSDLMVKDAYIAELRTQLGESTAHAAEIRDELNALHADLAARGREIDQLEPLAEYGAMAQQRAAYRMADAISRRLSRVHGAFPLMRWVVRRLFRP